MLTPKAFFDRVKKEIHNGGLSQSQVDGLNRLVSAYEKRGWPIYYASYGLATSHRECGGLYQPVREGFKKTDADARYYVRRHYPTKYGKPTVHGGQYAYGRGDVQLTWAYNYEKADEKLAEMGLINKGDLIANFDLALRPDISVQIMIHGMEEGWFTSKKLSDYLNKPVPDFYNARRIINGTDHAAEIAEVALKFQYALADGGYRQNYTPLPTQVPATPPVEPPRPQVSLEPVPTVPEPQKPAGVFDFFRKFFG